MIVVNEISSYCYSATVMPASANGLGISHGFSMFPNIKWNKVVYPASLAIWTTILWNSLYQGHLISQSNFITNLSYPSKLRSFNNWTQTQGDPKSKPSIFVKTSSRWTILADRIAARSYWRATVVCLSVCLWRAYEVLWLNDTSYSKSVWRSKCELPSGNMILHLSTPFTDHISHH